MENIDGVVITELSRIQGLVRQLERHLAEKSLPVQMCRTLTEEIMLSTDKTIAVIRKRPAASPAVSGSPSPLSGISDLPFTPMSKKRKTTMAKSKSQVRVSSVAGAEGPIDDGYSWRKYGQKDILGATYPRAYYRCTHRPTQGCQATKQVQRTDADASLFDVIYNGDHTCSTHTPNLPPPAPPAMVQQHCVESYNPDLLFQSLTVKTEGLLQSMEEDDDNAAAVRTFFSSFTSPSTPENHHHHQHQVRRHAVVVANSPMTEDSNNNFFSKCADTSSEVVSAPVTASSSPAAAADVELDLDLDFEMEKFMASHYSAPAEVDSVLLGAYELDSDFDTSCFFA